MNNFREKEKITQAMETTPHINFTKRRHFGTEYRKAKQFPSSCEMSATQRHQQFLLNLTSFPVAYFLGK
jgi:hypothetical protein